MIKIDKNVPLPESSKYPLDKLEVGDSFLVPANRRSSVITIIARITRRSDKRFTSRKEGDGIRFWRTE